MSSPERDSAAPASPERINVLLAQYRECSAAHIHFMSLIWQVPAVTVAASGALIAVTYGYDVPDEVRALITALGAFFLLAMTVAVERYRMFQLRRRRDLAEIETELAPLSRSISWDGAQIVAEIRRGEFVPRGVVLYRWEGFKALRAMMYASTVTLAVLAVLSIVSAIT